MSGILWKSVELVVVLFLPAVLGSFGYDGLEKYPACSLCKNRASLEVGIDSRRTLVARKLSGGGPSLLYFAKMRPSELATSTSELDSADVAFPLADFSGPSRSIVVSISAAIAPPVAGTYSNLAYFEECRQVCPDGYTYTPPSVSSCNCVIPMHARFRLGINLERLFPLVSELSKELAAGLSLQTSQVLIVGANAVSTNQDVTNVSADLVPLDTKFDITTAHLLASRLRSGLVTLNDTLFGTYDVIFITYPGLPPPSSQERGRLLPPGPANQLASGLDPDLMNQKLSSGLITVIALASAMGVLLFIGFVWLILLRCSLSDKIPPSVVGPLHAYFNSKPEGLQLMQLRMNAYFNSRPEGSFLPGNMANSRTMSYASSMAKYTGTAKTFSLAELERATSNFRPANIVGEGGFGRVHKGMLDSGIEVAVKVLTRDDHQVGGLEFIAEVEMLSRLHHRNLVKLIGICTDGLRCLVYELITNCSVESHLHGMHRLWILVRSNKTQFGDASLVCVTEPCVEQSMEFMYSGIYKYTAPLDWDARVKIALGAARGLAYLHEDSQPRVIHRL